MQRSREWIERTCDLKLYSRSEELRPTLQRSESEVRVLRDEARDISRHQAMLRVLDSILRKMGSDEWILSWRVTYYRAHTLVVKRMD